ncbi:MAG: hypothetical protein ABI559_03580 [Chloroflexota bacterium]
MRTLLTRTLIALVVCSLALMLQGGETHAISALRIEPYVWQFDRDYPEGSPADSSLPINTVYIKTHDGTDWMSTYDKHPAAVSGVDAIKNLISIYNQQGIAVSAWFVPARTDIDGQVAMAEQVIDAGVTSLYADIEPFSGFCNNDCGLLADTFWPRVRADRPNARLGVIYDPRSWWWDQSATKKWLANANVAVPMCYWDDFVGLVPYGDPQGCIAQAKDDLRTTLAPGKTLEYEPALEGDSTYDKMENALDASVRADAHAVSIWRRGAVSQDVWNGIAAYQAPGGPHCALNLVDGCIVKEASVPTAWVIANGGKIQLGNLDGLPALGLTARDVQTIPSTMLKNIPRPPDGTLITEGDGHTYVLYGGARFEMSDGDYAPLGLDPANTKTVPPGTIAQLVASPADYSLVQQVGDPLEYVTLKGARIPLDDDGLASLTAAGHANAPKYVLPVAAFSQIPLAEVVRGDSDCDGTIELIDVVRVLQRAIGVPSPAICLHVAGDVTCDGYPASVDALLILSYVAGVPQSPSSSCPNVGVSEPAALPLRETAAEAASSPPTLPPVSDTPLATGTPPASAADTDSPTPQATAGASVTPRATHTP